jgi:hypothetical protein
MSVATTFVRKDGGPHAGAPDLSSKHRPTLLFLFAAQFDRRLLETPSQFFAANGLVASR